MRERILLPMDRTHNYGWKIHITIAPVQKACNLPGIVTALAVLEQNFVGVVKSAGQLPGKIEY